ncbi:organic cation transporter -like [Brachionus plicatilis]|uniref:Organic cation transporter-like n=1 Tax=Brachionus plicatilis TaxID=10195 RepID=A0A3M7SAV4_BRAPC|nr:organic cation transporter -like [Brachionus plicatilis]
MDILLDSIKAFGRSQIIYLLIFGLLMITSALNFYASVFFAAEPLLVCREGDFIFTNITDAETCFLWQQYLANRINNISSALVCQFETNVYKLTIVSDYELVCDRKYLISLSQSFFFFGCLSGFFNGFLSDRYGRLVYILACELTLEKYHTIFTNIMISFYVIGEIVIMAAFYFMLSSLIFWIVIPESPKKKTSLFIKYRLKYQFSWLGGNFIKLSLKNLVSIFFDGCFKEFWNCLKVTIQVKVMTCLENLLFSWIKFHMPAIITGQNRHLNISFIVTRFFKTIVKTLLWLYETNSYDKCLEILKKISKINGRKLEYNPSEIALLKQKSVTDNPLKDLDESILRKIFLNKYNVLYIIGLFLVWNSINLQYTTTSLGIISSLEINPYLMFVLNACFELVGAWFSMMGDWIGRKKAFNLSILAIGVGSIVMTFIPEDDTNIDEAKYYLILKAIVSLLSRFMQSASYNLSIIYSVNLFDIKIRSTVLLFLGCAGSISTLIAPQINMLKSTWKNLPYYANAATSFGSGLIIFFMPEGYKKSQAIDMD